MTVLTRELSLHEPFVLYGIKHIDQSPFYEMIGLREDVSGGRHRAAPALAYTSRAGAFLWA
ncbi:hypothetical protein CEV34_2496 [Brucella pseudogrignonensis]|uniref:Uncharacterized protein n=1 Tax=Brucella pseudogrignonensis TaxID=419475 RepID=A0A256GGD4_9HYPH|nr:hypothetical protein CEV34_2496 [Brucella pseudogrignonensis]